MAENEVIGIGIEARLEAFRQQMAEIPEIGAKEAKSLAAQLSQEIKAAEKASRAWRVLVPETLARVEALWRTPELPGLEAQSATLLADWLGLPIDRPDVAEAAARAGLREGDVITAIANTEIANLAEWEALAARLDKSRPVNVLYRRGEWAQYALIRPTR